MHNDHGQWQPADDESTTPWLFHVRLLALLLLMLSASAGAVDGEDLLVKIDRWRLPAASLEVETEVDFIRGGVTEKTRRYRVWVAPGRRTLALFQHPAERGQKALMLEDAYWLFLPGAARPVRVTPLQKLVGDASVGDIAALSLADDYRVEASRVEEGILRANLSARRPGVTYASIVMDVDPGSFAPLRARFHAAGGRLLKEAVFVRDRNLVTAMELADAVETDRLTRVRYVARHPREFPAGIFNPAYLARNPELK